MSDLTQERLKKLLRYIPESGWFVWRVTRTYTAKPGKRAGCICPSSGYIVIKVDGKTYKAHRLAWLYTYGRWPEEVDHINRNRRDNRIENLRAVVKGENQRNHPVSVKNTSGIRGVVWNKKGRKFHSRISVDGNYVHLGVFDNFFDACCARKSAELKHGYHPNHGRAL